MIRRTVLLATIGLLPALLLAEDWPRWMGPRGDQISKETDILAKIEQPPKELWSAKVGQGYSSPIAYQGKIYLFSVVNKQDVLHCFDAASGKVLWEQSYDGGYVASYPGTRATPTIEGQSIYTYGGNGDLVCRNLEDGKLVWRINILRETKGKNQGWGVSGGPALIGDTIYVQGGVGGNAAVAVSLDGKIKWKSEELGGGYAYPIMAQIGDVRQLICFANKALLGINPQDGKTLWKHEWVTDYDVNAVTPVFSDGHLFITSNYKKGALIMKLSATGATKVLETKEVTGHYQPVILDRGHLYVNSDGTLKCVSFPDGAIKWSSPRTERRLLGPGGTMVRVDDRLLVLSDRGVLSVVKATPEGMERLSQIKLLEANEVWSTPLVYQGRLYVKADISGDEKKEPKLFCYDIKAQ